MRTPKDVLVEEVEFLREGGAATEAIVEQLGMTTAAVARSLQRAGRHELARPFASLERRERALRGWKRRAGSCADCGTDICRQSTRCRSCEVTHRWGATA